MFLTAGIGNGSVFLLIPRVFVSLHERQAAGQDEEASRRAISDGQIEASVALGFTASIAALGLFFIPALVAMSIDLSGLPRAALILFAVFYACCLAITWWWYMRKGSEAHQAWEKINGKA